jgi:hypothetical protein
MSNLTQKDVRAKADKWAAHQKAIEKLEAKKSEELSEFEAQYRAAVAEINDVYEPKLQALREKAETIKNELIAWLEKHGKPIAVLGAAAEAVNEWSNGNRVVDPKKFYALAKDKFFECVTVGVKKAEEVLGKETVDEISTKPKKLVASLRLRS